MELTQKQIKYIEDRLIKDGVKYWDIRLEILDHVVTDVEKRIDLGEKFRVAVQNSFISLGWKENFNGSCFEELITEKHKIYASRYNRNYWKYFKEAFLKTSTLVYSVSLLLVLYFFREYNLFMKIATLLYLIIVGTLMFYFIMKYKVSKSIQLQNIVNRITFSSTFINAFVYLPELFDIHIYRYPLIIILVFWFACVETYFGISFFLEQYKKVDKIYKQLLA